MKGRRRFITGKICLTAWDLLLTSSRQQFTAELSNAGINKQVV